MRRNKLGILTLAALTIATASPVMASSQIRIAINNENIALTDASPYMANGRTYVPIRVVSENLGAKVNWVPTTSTFEVALDKIEILGKVNQSRVLVNKAETPIDSQNSSVTATMKNGRVYVPIRFFAETTGYNVNYDNATNTVYINDSDTPMKPIAPTEKPSTSSGSVIYKTGMSVNSFCKQLSPKLPHGKLSSYGGSIIFDGGYVIIGSASDVNPEHAGYSMTIDFWGWSTSRSPIVSESSTISMKRVSEILPFYTKDSQKVYDEITKAFENDLEGHIITTSDGRTFKVLLESDELVVK